MIWPRDARARPSGARSAARPGGFRSTPAASDPAAVGETAAKARARGFRAFKLKIGFGAPRDRANLAEIRETIGDDALMVDANQAWDVEAAMRGAEMAAEFGALWLEEPLAADAPAAAWRALAAASPVPLAAGENVLGEAAFESLVAEGSVSVIQPDLGKWGGVTGCLAVARRALGAGRRFCPHWLGGGVGLAASAHLLAAAGGDGLLEVDVNPNPFRERLFDDLVVLDGTGSATLPDAPGLGVTPDIDSLAPFRTL
jgi:D-galactarolactone cycloisomerase